MGGGGTPPILSMIINRIRRLSPLQSIRILPLFLTVIGRKNVLLVRLLAKTTTNGYKQDSLSTLDFFTIR